MLPVSLPYAVLILLGIIAPAVAGGWIALREMNSSREDF